MACVKLCVKTAEARFCVRIQCRKVGAVHIPSLDPYFVDPVIFELAGQEAEWTQDLNAIATVAHAAEWVSPALGKVLNDTVSHMVSDVSRRLPSGVSIELDQH